MRKYSWTFWVGLIYNVKSSYEQHTEEKTEEHRGRDWRDVVSSQGSQGIPSHEKLEEAKKDSFLEPLEGVGDHKHLDFRCTASWIVRE